MVSSSAIGYVFAGSRCGFGSSETGEETCVEHGEAEQLGLHSACALVIAVYSKVSREMSFQVAYCVQEAT